MPLRHNIIEVPSEWCGTLGAGARVGICDTALDESHPAFKGMKITVSSFVSEPEHCLDRKHGTHVASTIAKISPLACVLFAKTTPGRSGREGALLGALEWLKSSRIDVINMSLAYHRENKDIAAILEEMDNEGTIILCAKASVPRRYPSCYPFVISVDKSSSSVDDGGKVELFGPEELFSAVPGGGTGTMKGSSVSCAYASGIACLAKGYDKTINRKMFISSLRTQPSSR